MISYNPRAFLQTWCLRKSCRSPETDISHFTGVLDVRIGLIGGKNLKKMTTYFTGTATILTPWSSVTLEKLIGAQPVTKYPVFYGTRMFFTLFITAGN